MTQSFSLEFGGHLSLPCLSVSGPATCGLAVGAVVQEQLTSDRNFSKVVMLHIARTERLQSKRLLTLPYAVTL